MKSFGFLFIIIAVLLSGLSPVFGQAARHDGPYQAYSRRVQVSISDCGQYWKKRLPNVAGCEVPADTNSNSIVWNAGRLSHKWHYSDQEWNVDISIYHTQTGYRIDMYGSKPIPEYFEYEVARKYIESSLYDLKSGFINQVVMRPKKYSAYPGEMSIGSVEVVSRKLNIQNEGFLAFCSRNWRNGECFINLVSGNSREALLEAEILDIKWGDLHLKSKGFTAWSSGSGLSDYKVVIGTSDKNMSFNQFKRKWKRRVPQYEVEFKLQKFSKLPHPHFVTDEFMDFVSFEKYQLEANFDECMESFRVNSNYESECRMNLPEGTVPQSQLELMNKRFFDNGTYVTVWARIKDYKIIVDILSYKNIAQTRESFWDLFKKARSEADLNSILLMRYSYQ